jgi:hypothetical protein
MAEPAEDAAPGPFLEADAVRAVFDRAAAAYFAERHARVGGFVDRHFSFRGSLALHRHAVGLDIVRAPVNLVMSAPTAALKAAALVGRKTGRHRAARWLETRDLFLDTDLGRHITWLIQTELLELPYAQGGRTSRRDAFAEAMFADPSVDRAMRAALAAVERRAGDPDFRRHLEETFAAYAGSRAAAAEIATGLITLSVGAATVNQMTPGMMSLGPSLAALVAQHAAIAAFPLGPGIGALWYGVFPAAASPALVAGMTGGLMALGAGFAAFAGLLTDPVQRRLGLHQRRLHRMIDVLERTFRGDGVPGKPGGSFEVRDYYVARLLDLLDYLALAWRAAA